MKCIVCFHEMIFSFVIFLAVPPNMPEIISHHNGTIVEVPFSQQSLQLTCIATNARPAAVLKWLRNGQEITEGVDYIVEDIENDKRQNSQNTLSFSPQYPEDNNAIYECQAQNDALIAGPLRVMVKLSVLCKSVIVSAATIQSPYNILITIFQHV